MTTTRLEIMNAVTKLTVSYIDRCLHVDYKPYQIKEIINDWFVEELSHTVDITLLEPLKLEDFVCEAMEEVEKHYGVHHEQVQPC